MQDEHHRDDIIEVVRCNPMVIRNPILSATEFAVIEAVIRNGMTLQYATPKLRDDPKVVALAAKQNWRAMKFAGAAQQGNKDIVEKTVKQNGLVIQYADPELKKDRRMIIEAMKYNMNAIWHAHPEVWADKHFWDKAMKLVPGSWKVWQEMGDKGLLTGPRPPGGFRFE